MRTRFGNEGWGDCSSGLAMLFGPGSWLAAVAGSLAISEVTVAPKPPLADIQRYVAVS